MAHVVTGIDVGAHSVKFVLIDVGFRHTRLMSSFEEIVPAGDAPLSERQGEALQIGLARLPAEAIPYMALPGEMLAVRALDLPFSDARKIEQVVGYELEGQIVHALQDVVFDHVVCKPRGGEGSTVLAAAARVDEVGDLLAALNVRGVEPRSLFVAPVVYQTLFKGERAPLPTDPVCRVLIDIGHRRTNVCFLLHGETGLRPHPAARGRGPDRRGGRRLPVQPGPGRAGQARGGHHRQRRPAAPGSHPPAHGRGAARGPGAALARDPPDHRQLPGPGEGRHRGRAADRRDGGADGPGRVPGRGAGPAGVALRPESPGQMADPPPGRPGRGASPWPRPSPGRARAAARSWTCGAGPSSTRPASRCCARRRATWGPWRRRCWSAPPVDGSMSLSRLDKEKETLQAQLRTATTELFGEPRMDAKAVSTALRKKFSDEMAPIPKATAFDLLGEISKRIPPTSPSTSPTSTSGPRRPPSAAPSTRPPRSTTWSTQLKLIDCFEEITKGPVTEVSGGSKQFLLTINSKCP
jgi:general secretion pathway protein L